ncbi:hypothetical protein M1P97_09120 [Parabacteroides sp. GYB001]|uniref:hypothetical protein n=1 Tax=Parabacteroides leei TaxID=2939491 RepID=UPI0020171D29|nr:hypothetical protein [Parabacteroides leei]MCL3851445.1 hypothetical protein [Parabacteroides leei]
MKKIFYSLIMVIMCNMVFAQNDHLEFKDIQIDGNINSFVEKMKQNGFVLVTPMKDNLTAMSGNFVGKKCEIYILSTPKTKKACKVVVFLPESENWSDIKSDYFSYKDLYTKKYGDPKDSFNFFTKPYYEGDGYEMQALRKKKCTYASYWITDKGTIAVDISSSQQISFGYEDKINMSIYSQEQEAESINDI